MRFIACAAIAILAMGCSSSPTAPSSAAAASSAPVDQATKPSDHVAGWRSVTLFFDGHGLPLDGHKHQVGYEHLVGLPVHLKGSPSGTDYRLATGRQATVSADFPRSDDLVSVDWANWEGWCGGSALVHVPVPSTPGVPQEDWIVVTNGC